MPIKAGDRDRRVVALRIAPLVSPLADHREHDDADRHMQRMEAGGDQIETEEQPDRVGMGARLRKIQPGQQMLLVLFVVFDPLQGQEDDAEQRRSPEQRGGGLA